MVKRKLTEEMKRALSNYYNLLPSNLLFSNAKVNFTKLWGMSPGYMTLMYK